MREGRNLREQAQRSGRAAQVRLNAKVDDIELENWRDKPPLSLDDLFRNPAVHERVGKLIARAMGRSVGPGWD
jgi:hypothetical protein